MKFETIDRIDLRTLLCFERVAVLGSFSAASRQLQMPRAAVSRLVQKLEGQVGTKLFQRTTRNVSMTEEGQALLNDAMPSLATLRTALLEATTTNNEVRGTVRFSVSQAFGRRFVLPALPSFLDRFPHIRLDMSVADDLDDLVTEGLDFAIRIGALPDSSLVTHKVAEIDVVLAMSASLVQGAEGPVTLDQLERLPQIGFRIPGTFNLYRWHFEKDGQVHTHTPTEAQLVTDSIEDIAQLVVAGAGIAPVPRYLVQDHIMTGAIAIGVPAYTLPSIPLQICFPGRGKRPARVKALADHLTHHVQKAWA